MWIVEAYVNGVIWPECATHGATATKGEVVHGVWCTVHTSWFLVHWCTTNSCLNNRSIQCIEEQLAQISYILIIWFLYIYIWSAQFLVHLAVGCLVYHQHNRCGRIGCNQKAPWCCTVHRALRIGAWCTKRGTLGCHQLHQTANRWIKTLGVSIQYNAPRSSV